MGGQTADHTSVQSADHVTVQSADQARGAAQGQQKRKRKTCGRCDGCKSICGKCKVNLL